MAQIIVEDGTNVLGANSYVSEAELLEYASDRGITLTLSPSVLLLRAMDYLEGLRYQGWKYNRYQGLQWPRQGVFIDGFCQQYYNIPKELKNAQIQVALAIDAGYDPLAVQTKKVVREKVDVVEVQYSESSANAPILLAVNAALSKLLAGNGAGSNVINVYRG